MDSDFFTHSLFNYLRIVQIIFDYPCMLQINFLPIHVKSIALCIVQMSVLPIHT